MIAGERLEKDDLLIERKAAEGKCAGAYLGLVAELDTALTPELRREGLGRELINRIQQRRKEMKLNLLDKIQVTYFAKGLVVDILAAEKSAPTNISGETLTKHWAVANGPEGLSELEQFEDHGDAAIQFKLEVSK